MQTLKWNTKVDERTKEKIELLYREFDRFIEENHSSGNQEDLNMLKQWANFKQVIEKGPTDFDNMNQYINKLGEDSNETAPLRVSTTSRTSQNPSQSPASRTNVEKKGEISTIRLKRVSLDLLNAIGKNNK